MKLIFILIFSISIGFAQTNKGIKNIKEKYTRVTKLLALDSLAEVSLENECKENGQTEASLTFYYDNKTLVYILHNYDEGHSNYTNHYYIDNNKLIFYFLEYATWQWDYECSPKEQTTFTNEIWTYEEQRIYFHNETPVKCLHKTYYEKSIDHNPQEDEYILSNTIKNKEKDCNNNNIEQIIKKYHLLLTIQNNTDKNICDISID